MKINSRLELMLKKKTFNKESLSYGILCYFLLFVHPLLAVGSSLLLYKHLSRWMLISILALFFGVAGYFYEPQPEMDLDRYYVKYETGRMFDVDKTERSADVDAFVFFLFAVLEMVNASSHYIGAVAGFIFCLLLACIALEVESLLDKRMNFVLIYLILLLSNFLLDFTGLRYSNSVLFFILSFIYYQNGKIKKSILCSIMTCLFHITLLPIVLLFWISQTLNKKLIYILSLVLFVGSVFFLPIMDALRNVLPKIGLIGMGIAYKITAYVFADWGVEELYSGSRFWPLQKILSFIMIIILLLFYRKELRLIKLGNFRSLLIITSYVCFIFSSEQMFFRTLLINNYLTSILGLLLLFVVRNNIKRYILYSYLILFLFCGIMASLSGLEFVSLFFSSGIMKYNYFNLIM